MSERKGKGTEEFLTDEIDFEVYNYRADSKDTTDQINNNRWSLNFDSYMS